MRHLAEQTGHPRRTAALLISFFATCFLTLPPALAGRHAASASDAVPPAPQTQAGQRREPPQTQAGQRREPAQTQAGQRREPAQTMSYRGAPWLERAEREEEERPEEVLDAMGLQPGDVVADIGVGSGYFARRIGRRVGPDGTVYGVDIQPEMLDILMNLAEEEGVTNIEPVLSEQDDPKLPPGAIDWILLVDVYHEISDPEPMLARMREALAPDGRVALLEYRLEDSSGDHIRTDHRMAIRQVLAEWKPAGFELIELHEFLPSQHMFVFRAAAAESESRSATAPPIADHDLLAAIEQDIVEAEAIGAGQDQVTVRIRRNVPRRIVITAPAGTYFAARGSSRDMVASSDAGVTLFDDGWTNWMVRATGAGGDRPVPDENERFEIRPAAARR